jgi:hypothetical protein
MKSGIIQTEVNVIWRSEGIIHLPTSETYKTINLRNLLMFQVIPSFSLAFGFDFLAAPSLGTAASNNFLLDASSIQKKTIIGR